MWFRQSSWRLKELDQTWPVWQFSFCKKIGYSLAVSKRYFFLRACGSTSCFVGFDFARSQFRDSELFQALSRSWFDPKISPKQWLIPVANFNRIQKNPELEFPRSEIHGGMVRNGEYLKSRVYPFVCFVLLSIIKALFMFWQSLILQPVWKLSVYFPVCWFLITHWNYIFLVSTLS